MRLALRFARTPPVSMDIIYHHRTRSTDAQRIHILAIIEAFRKLGHRVDEVSLIPAETEVNNPERDAGEAGWKRVARRIPFTYELVQCTYNLIGLLLMFRRLRSSSVDLIYERYSAFNFTGVLSARWFRIPIVIEVNSPFALEQSRDGDIRLRRLAVWSERRICNAADVVVVVSTPLRDILTKLGVAPRKIVVIPNGVDLECFQRRQAGDDFAGRYGIAGKVVIGFVGWFRNWHKLDMLLESYSRSDLLRRSAKIMLVGDGPETSSLQEFVSTHGLGDGVVFTGPLPHNQVPAHVELFDVAVQPAANEYCCPMKIIEYLAMGKPIVAPRQANIRDLVRDGVEAALFEPEDAASLTNALEQLVANPERRVAMAASAQRLVEERGFLWTHNAQQVIDQLGVLTS